MACTSLSPGESRLVYQTETGLPAMYALRRLVTFPESRYEAIVNIDFRGAAGVSAEHVRAVSEKTDRCLHLVSDYLGGPGGERLALRRYVPGMEGEIPSPVTVTVDTQPVRGHAHLWRDTWSCAQIVHEVFHLVGLVDEYRETQLETFDCRAEGPDDSIMAFPGLAYQKATRYVEVVECRCDDNDSVTAKECRAELDRIEHDGEPPYCPLTGKEHMRRAYQELFADEHLPADARAEALQLEMPRGKRTGKGSLLFRRSQDGARRSLLMPAQFNAIVYPGCESNRSYYQCASNAYRTSRTRGGAGCLARLPKECRHGSRAWVSHYDFE